MPALPKDELPGCVFPGHKPGPSEPRNVPSPVSVRHCGPTAASSVWATHSQPPGGCGGHRCASGGGAAGGRGRHPLDAGREALKRVRADNRAKRLQNRRGLPRFDLAFYILNRQGQHVSAALYAGARYAVCTDAGPRLLPVEALLDGRSSD